MVSVLNSTILFIFKWLILRYANYIFLKKKDKKHSINGAKSLLNHVHLTRCSWAQHASSASQCV